ncbi:MAG: GGDEF domain-containing protein [Thermodesulfobacteriota bacterium]
MSPASTREQIGNDYLAFLGKRESEETQANHFLGVLMDSYPLHSVSILTLDKQQAPSVFAQRGLSGSFIKELYAKGTLPVVGAAFSGTAVLPGGDPRLADPAWRFEHESKALFAAPCRVHGKTVGAFIAEFRESALADSVTREAFDAYAQMSAILIALKGHLHEIGRIPEIDPLTGLGTFKTFHEVMLRELSRGKRTGEPFSLVFIKVLHLREMNDVYGHTAADESFVELSNRVKTLLRGVDSVSRSGMSLYIVMPETPKSKATAVAARIASAMDASAPARKDVVLKVAIGVASYPEDGGDEKTLITHTEAMVHESVRKGGNAFTALGD